MGAPPQFDSVQGFQYCDLLLSQGKYQVVLTRAGQTIKIAKRNNWPQGIAYDHLSLGRAYLLQAREEEKHDFTKAADHLNQAIEGLRQVGAQEYIIRGILARAELYRVRGDLNSAKHDLDEAMNLAERSGMGLYQVDCHLEYCRVFLAIGDKGKAKGSFDTAKEMIEKIGYHLRDKDLNKIEEQLKAKSQL